MIPPTPPIVTLARRLAILFSYGLAFLVGLSLGVMLVGYQVRVAAEQMRSWGGRLILLEEQYQRDHNSTVSKAAAQVIVSRKEGR